MTLRLLTVSTLAFFALVAPAGAEGPVFIVVPNAPATSVAPSASSLRAQLAADRAALAQSESQKQLDQAALAQSRATSASAVLLSDRLDAEQSDVQLELALNATNTRADELRQHIDDLTSQLQLIAPPPFAPLPADSGIGASAVAIAEQYLGAPYTWGGADPSTGFDCSGLTTYVYEQLGIQLPHYAAAQWAQLPHVNSTQLQPGDLVFFEPDFDGPGHVGIYVGGDSFIEAPHTGDVVKFASLSAVGAELGYVGAARPLVGTLIK
ncbi:MAG TPA: C40 family peptidase [Gaiellaceae bacterium]|jgi:cell wall-associated NlpC family hydrolase